MHAPELAARSSSHGQLIRCPPNAEVLSVQQEVNHEFRTSCWCAAHFY